MKSLNRLILPIIAGNLFLGGCNSSSMQEPKKQNFTNSGYECTQVENHYRICFYDVDNDRIVDGVTEGSSNLLIYLAQGYSMQFLDRNYTHAKIMSPGLRKSFSKVFQGVQEAKFDMAMMDYKKEDNKKLK